MKFEEALPLLRKGKKFRIKDYDDELEYWKAGYISILEDGEKLLTLHRFNHDDKVLVSSHDWGIPRWAVMCDYWELIEE